jgi:hypothetical protein
VVSGSSREFTGFDTAPSAGVVAAILSRAAAFLPSLQHAADAARAAAAAAGSESPPTVGGTGAQTVTAGGGGHGGGGKGGALEGLSVRVGLRPFAVGGLPLIGPVDGAPGRICPDRAR